MIRKVDISKVTTMEETITPAANALTKLVTGAVCGIACLGGACGGWCAGAACAGW